MSKPVSILISDPFSDDGIALLSSHPDIQVDVKPGLAPADLLAIIPNYDMLIVRSGTQVTKEVIAAGKRLKLIGRAGIGVDNVDVKAASHAGIVVMNTPEGNATTAAEHAIALLFSLARHIPQATASMKAGKWEKSKFKGSEISGKTLGILGLGNIGRIVARLARGINLEVLAFDPVVTPARAEEAGAKLCSLEELLKESDFITIHAPLTPATKYLLNGQNISLMKKGVKIINAARGGIVDENALLAALETGQVSAAALDVFEEEPPTLPSPLINHPNVIATPHLGASTEEAQKRVALQIAEQVIQFVNHGETRNAVNVPNLTSAELTALAPYMELAQLLGSFLGQITKGGSTLNVQIKTNDLGRSYTAVTHSAIAGFLGAREATSISWLLAAHRAYQCGLKIMEASQTSDMGNIFSMQVSIDGSAPQHTISGAWFNSKGPRITQIDEYEIEAIPDQYLLLLENEDIPGVIGRVGTYLGTQNINVSRMQLGLAKNKRALSLWNLDQPLGEIQLEALRQQTSISKATAIQLFQYNYSLAFALR